MFIHTPSIRDRCLFSSCDANGEEDKSGLLWLVDCLDGEETSVLPLTTSAGLLQRTEVEEDLCSSNDETTTTGGLREREDVAADADAGRILGLVTGFVSSVGSASA
jgi:hypothetical protein